MGALSESQEEAGGGEGPPTDDDVTDLELRELGILEGGSEATFSAAGLGLGDGAQLGKGSGCILAGAWV